MNDLLRNSWLYALAFVLPLGISLALTPLLRVLALRFGHLDKPTDIKTHKVPTPLLGGAAIFIAFTLSLLAMRFYTSFPTGTLRDLRIILLGGGVMFTLGFIDDMYKPHGLGVKTKFAVQFAVAVFTALYGIRINFIQPDYLAFGLTVLWIVGVSNAFNIIDIMDGLSAGQAALAAFGFLLIAFPSESIYVNFASASLAGAAAGFLPYNFSRNFKIFMGDSGSLLCGFVLSLVALGTRYSDVNPLGVYAPLFILAVPIYDTVFVSVLRLRRGHSPFIGSKDHFALRLEKIGFSRRQVVRLASLATLALVLFAWLMTQVPLAWGIVIAVVLGLESVLIGIAIAKIKI